MLCRKIIRYESTAKNIRQLESSYRALYRDNMASKYHFSPQAVHSSLLCVLEKSNDLKIDFKESENVSMKIGQEEFSGVKTAHFCDGIVSYITKDDKMLHFYNDRLYDITPT
ncbi:hypothetical protein NO2_0397 [Candidatus Termititenax persephonae]|uniref:Uncharacterized protein n=1 Tax=Candidatus Termititenax persephonae TaxID=2218525 RepID=A0A388TFW2_9BACT|nr:hypothetical protein NO2_0397 [Candidatus Termititenax persephonae]